MERSGNSTNVDERTRRRWRATAALVVCLSLGVGCHHDGKKTAAALRRDITHASHRITDREPPPGELSTTDYLGLTPSNHRNWIPQHAVTPSAEWDGATVYVKNIRNFDYVTESDFVARYYDKKYDLKNLETVDFIVVPFKEAPMLAHTMLSFGFRGGDYLVSSVEVRLEEGETYSPVLGAMRQYEIIYVLADERDVIRLRTELRQNEVFAYRAKATPEQIRSLFVDVIDRANKLHDTPEFYDTFTNNCTTNIVTHVNRLAPNRVPYNIDVLLPGLSAKLAYDVGLLDNSIPFEELSRRSRITELAHRYRDAPDFSQKIRR